ncbi:uncharacterized protein MYCFIDRAFT_209476 [Pseudocercospora fijiensis CIRAD86]|uniref:GRF-type domain-containing protein n=1 Tax=Pseudocercospora fijiensis (strain CIRAD86) TaxID=383855 RepID=N1Q8V5_PSEFD|nr:uncharacterized protein MYCFIDRAFT_209476 [Pseudocercospora fijiensis CIRAD86]EME87318.1 hypothetical protein MYCFIDRAFT_209476 [Pseudocercospora fijiensis CIRAD86]
MQKARYRSNRGGFRGGRGRGGNTLKGLFDNGIWYCNCTPRMPAEHFKVKKEGKNKDRWFYTCQQPSDSAQRCDFFLWNEDAKLRETAAVFNNSRSEPKGPEAQEGWTAGRDAQGKMVNAREASPTPTSIPSYPTLPGANVGLKRNALEAQLGDDDDDDKFSLDGQEEEAMFKAADNISSFETPHKAQRTGVYATPATSDAKKSSRKLPWLKDPQIPATPISGKKTVLDFFNTSPSKVVPSPARAIEPQTPPVVSTLPAIPESPSPTSRFKNALHNPADSQSSLTNEVLQELSTVRLPPEKLESLRSILSKHDLRTQGIRKGRDISRLALRAKEARIVELEARITSLQAEKEVDRSIVERMKWRNENQVQNDEETEDEL